MRWHFARTSILLIVATLGCRSSSTGLRPVPARVTILGPDPLILDISTPYRVAAHVYDASGALLDGSVRVSWSSTDTTVAQIDAAGTVSMRRLGSTFIRASVDSGSGGA